LAIKSRAGSTDDTDVGKSSATLVGIALLAGAAIYLGRAYLFPATERSERREAVLTGKLDPRLDEIVVLQDSELPAGVTPPRVGEDAMFIRITVLYPALPEVPEPKEHRLAEVNGRPGAILDPAHVETEVDQDGARVHLTFRVAPDFISGTIARGKTTVLSTVVLE